MKRETLQEAAPFDLVIVGGGIHGAVLALDAARSGYRVALLEKGDFGYSTSANSLKIIHGGIRYLQHGDFKRMRESIVSRRRMMTFAPHIVKPLACLMPTYGHGIKGREMMRLAFAIYDLIAFDRNEDLAASNLLPLGGSLSRDEVRRVVPGIAEGGLTGGAVWYDAIALDTERLILEYVLEAARYGAVVANYTEARELVVEGGRVQGVVVRARQTGQDVRLRCRAVVNAAGPWLEKLPGSNGSLAGQLYATAINLIVKKQLFKDYAVGLEGYTDFTDKDALIKRGKRLFFFVPWQNKYTMIGTTYTPYRGHVDDFTLQRQDIENILGDINKIYPHGQLTMADVTFGHGGLLPMNEADDSKADSVQLDKSSMIIDHGKVDGRKGLLSIKGVKYTTAPDIAERVVKKLRQENWLGQRAKGSYAAVAPRRDDFGPCIKKLGEEYDRLKSHLENRYGARWREVFRVLAEQGVDVGVGPSLWVSQDLALLEAEVSYFIREEMATTVADIVFRRTNLAAAQCPPRAVLVKIADILGRELGISGVQQEEQIGEVVKVFAIFHS